MNEVVGEYSYLCPVCSEVKEKIAVYIYNGVEGSGKSLLWNAKVQ